MAGVILAVVPLAPGRPAASPGASVLVVGGSPLLGKPAPAFTLEDLAGTPVSLADYAGRPVIVNFWASWCVPCREEFPAFRAAREAHAEAGLEILGIIHKDAPSSAQAFADAQGAAWPLLVDPGEAVYAAYRGIGGVPISIFVDGAGIVRAVSFGEVSEGALAIQLEEILPAAQAVRSGPA